MNGEQGCVWFLTGSQHLYGAQALEQVDEHSRQIVRALDASEAIPVSVVHRKALTDPDSIRRALPGATSAQRCWGVIVWIHTFPPARMWTGGLPSLRKPLLH